MINGNRHAIQVVHGYNEPFRSLSGLYARTLLDAGWQVTTVYLTGAASEDIRRKTIASNVVFLDTPATGLKGLKLGLILRVRRLFQETPPQLIIGQRYKPTYIALLASIFSAVPVIGVGHAFGVLHNTARQVLLWLFRQRLLMLGVSQAVTNDMRSDAAFLSYDVMHNAIDTAALEPRLLSRREARQHFGLDETHFVFGNVGRYHADKDQATLIRAFAIIAKKFPQARLVLAGQGKLEKNYHELVTQLSLQDQVTVTGPVPDAASLFPAFDVYVSSSDREPFGIVLAEAMLAKLPVISTDCGGAPEVVGDSARFFPQGDAKALAALLEQALLSSPQERQQQGAQLYQRLQDNFSFTPFSQRLLAAVNRIAGS